MRKSCIVFRLLFLLPILVGKSYALEPGEESISYEFRIERSPLVRLEDREYPLPKDKAVEILLEDARFVLSGMIYGFHFSYTPSDNSREVEEEFSLEPIAVIPWGDPALSVVGTREAEGEFYVRIRYRFYDYQHPWITLWRSSSLPVLGGEGEASFTEGYSAKRTSIENAVKNSIREFFRARIYNKPKEIKGEVVFTRPPRTRIRAGAYKTDVRLTLRSEEVIPYQFY